MKKIGKVLAVSLLLAMVLSTTAFAASVSAYLNSSSNRVTTTFNSGSSGYHRVIVEGYEKHPTLQVNKYAFYSKTETVTGSGTMTTVHASDAGFEFQLSYAGTRLKSTTYFGGTYIGEVKVTR